MNWSFILIFSFLSISTALPPRPICNTACPARECSSCENNPCPAGTHCIPQQVVDCPSRNDCGCGQCCDTIVTCVNDTATTTPTTMSTVALTCAPPQFCNTTICPPDMVCQQRLPPCPYPPRPPPFCCAPYTTCQPIPTTPNPTTLPSTCPPTPCCTNFTCQTGYECKRQYLPCAVTTVCCTPILSCQPIPTTTPKPC